MLQEMGSTTSSRSKAFSAFLKCSELKTVVNLSTVKYVIVGSLVMLGSGGHPRTTWHKVTRAITIFFRDLEVILDYDEETKNFQGILSS